MHWHHAVSLHEVILATYGLGWSLTMGAFVWLAYMAVEPYICLSMRR
jgi:hypothetical protein